jgi:hypothetical protein
VLDRAADLLGDRTDGVLEVFVVFVICAHESMMTGL